MRDSVTGAVTARLKPGEALLWCGEPSPRRAARPAAIAAAVAGLALLIFWNRAAQPALIGCTVVAAAAYLRALRHAAHTVYALTDRRAIRLHRGAESSIEMGEAAGWRVMMHADGTGDVLFGNGRAWPAVRDAQAVEALLAAEPAWAIDTDPERLPVPFWTVKFVAGLLCCVASPLFDPFGYVLTLLGLFLLWHRSGFPLKVRLMATAVVLPPRLLPVIFAAAAGPGELSFVLDRSAPATSSTVWGWYGLLWAVCAVLVLVSSEQGRAFLAAAGLWRDRIMPGVAAVQRRSRFVPAVLTAALVIWATVAVLGLGNDFEWIEAGDAGRWTLKHSVRGTVASFTANEVAAIDLDSGSIGFRLNGGDSFGMTTDSGSAYLEMKKLAATMELPPGRMRLRFEGGEQWTNGAFNLASCTGTYVDATGNTVELRLERGRLAGTETVRGSRGGRLSRPVWGVKVTEDGHIEYRTPMFAGNVRNFAAGFGFTQGVLKDGSLEINGTRFEKRPATGRPAS